MVSNAEAIKRLRAKGQPIQLFGESEKDRRLRLRALELLDAAQKSAGTGNDLMRALEAMDQGQALEDLVRRGKVDSDVAQKLKDQQAGEVGEGSTVAELTADGDSGATREDGETIIDLSLIKKNPHKLYPQIYFALKVRLSFLVVSFTR